MSRHVVRCLIAGFVALLPVGGSVLGFVWLEHELADTWLARQDYYFPGMGILVALVLLYAVGLLVTTMLGRWLWRRFDRVIDSLPILGGLYQTVKQILGYGSGQDAVFLDVALVPSSDTGGVQVGLITDRGTDGRCAVFLPGSPNPSAGRLVWVDEASVTRVETSVADALKCLVSVGKGPLTGEAPGSPR